MFLESLLGRRLTIITYLCSTLLMLLKVVGHLRCTESLQNLPLTVTIVLEGVMKEDLFIYSLFCERLSESQIALALGTRVEAIKGWCRYTSCPKEMLYLFFQEGNVAICCNPSASMANCMLVWMLLR